MGNNGLRSNNSEKFNYNGTWEVINGQGYLNSMHFTNTPKSRVMIPYSGPRARIYGKKGPIWVQSLYIDLKKKEEWTCTIVKKYLMYCFLIPAD